MTHLSNLIVFIVGEIVALAIFYVVRRIFKESRTSLGPTFRGVLERAVLFVGLSYGFSQVLIAFGALKIGTRLHDEAKDAVSTNYFLVGNLISILLAMTYAIVANSFQ